MLSEGSEIKALNPERKVGFGLTDEPCQKLLGKEESDEEYWKELLVPTRIYTPYIEALQSHNIPIHGLAHITGGGIQNINRIHPQAQVKIDSFPDVQDSEVAGIFRMIKERSQISDDELFTTFNMGVGMAVVTSKPQETIDVIRDMGVPAWRIGEMIL